MNTTLGSCALCNRRPASGSGYFVGGAIALAIGLAVAVIAYQVRGLDLLSGSACVVAMIAGGFLLSVGLFRGVRSVTPRYAEGTLTVSPTTAAPGATLVAKVKVTPDHTLHLRSATVELQAVERIDSEERVVRTHEQPLPLPAPLREEAARDVSLHVPAGWPATMASPSGVSPARQLFTRVRVAVDADAHPLFVLDAPLTVTAA